jgi:hypothetical protein
MKQLIALDDLYPKPTYHKRSLVKSFFKSIQYLFIWSIFGLNKSYYWEKFKSASVFTVLVFVAAYYFGPHKNIQDFTVVLPFFINSFIYPFAKYLFPDKGRFRQYADEGIMVTMSKQEYDRSQLFNIMAPYFLSFIFAPIGLLTLFFDNWRRYMNNKAKEFIITK